MSQVLRTLHDIDKLRAGPNKHKVFKEPAALEVSHLVDSYKDLVH